MTVENYYSAGKAYALANREALASALPSCLKPFTSWRMTAWPRRGLSGLVDGGYGIPATPVEFASAAAFADDLRETAPQVRDKHHSIFMCHAWHREPEKGGHADERFECQTGLLLDCDAAQDPRALLARLRLAGAAHVFVKKPVTRKWHTNLPIVAWYPTDHKQRHHDLFQWVIGLFAGLGGVDLDRTMGNFLAVPDYAPHRRAPDEPTPLVGSLEGGALDVEALAKATGFVEPPRVASAVVAPPGTVCVAPADGRTEEQVQHELRLSLVRYRKTQDLRAAIAAVLSSEAFATTPGERWPMLRRLCNQIAITEPYADPHVLARVLLPSLEKILETDPAWQNGNPFATAVDLISGAQDYGQRRREADRQASERMLALLRKRR